MAFVLLTSKEKVKHLLEQLQYNQHSLSFYYVRLHFHMHDGCQYGIITTEILCVYTKPLKPVDRLARVQLNLNFSNRGGKNLCTFSLVVARDLLEDRCTGYVTNVV